MKLFLNLSIFCILITITISRPVRLNSAHRLLQLNQQQVIFKLSKAVFDKSEIGNFTNDLLFDCKGSLSGMFEVVKADQINLYSTTSLKPSQKFKCYPNKRLASKGVVEQEFSTVNFKLDKIVYTYEATKLRINLWFNEAIHFKSLKKQLKMFSHLKNSKNLLGYGLFPKRVSSHFIVDVDLTKDESTDQSFTIEIARELKSHSGIKFQSDYLGTIESAGDKVFKKDDTKAPIKFKDSPKFEALNKGKLQLKIYLPQLLSNSKPLDFISISPKVDIKVGVNEYNYYSYSDDSKSECFVTFEGDFKAQQQYEITLKKGFKTNHYELKNNKSFTLQTPDLKGYVKFTNKKNKLSSTNQSFGLEYTNHKHVKFVIQKLLPQNYRYFVNFQSGAESNFERYSKVVQTKTLDLSGEKNSIVSKVMSIKDFQDYPSGVYKLSIFSSLENSKHLLDSRMFHISDCGISALLTETNLLITTRSIETSHAMSNTLVQIYSRNNQLVFQGVSDSGGLLNYKFDQDRKGLFSIVAKHKKDKSFLMLDYPVGNTISNKIIQDEYKALIQLERSLIRPSETVSGVVLVKKNDFTSIDLPLKFVLKGSDGSIIQSELLKSKHVGVYEIKISSKSFWKTGTYDCQVWLGDSLLVSQDLQIESFLPPKVKNTISIRDTKLYANKNIELDLSSKYYFGAPAAGLKGQVKLSAFTKSNTLSQWKDYQFGDHRDLKHNDDFLLKSYPLIVPANGKLHLEIPLRLNRISTVVLEGLVAFSVFDDSKEVNSFNHYTIYPSDKMVGIKAGFSGRVKTKEIHSFECIVVDPITNIVSTEVLEARLYKKVWHYHYDSSRNYGGYSEQLVLVETKTIDSDQSLQFELSDSGNYYLEVSDLGGHHKSSISYYVSGWSYAGPNRDAKASKLKMSSDVKTVETDKLGKLKTNINLDIQAQMAGSLLLVVEDGEILYKKYYSMNGTTANIAIPLIDTNNKSFSVHAYLLRPANSSDAVVSFRAYGSIDINVSQFDHKIRPKIEVVHHAQSNQVVPVKVSSLKKGDVCFISAVDQGIYDMISEKYSDPFLSFLTKKKRSLEYYDFYDHLDYILPSLGKKSFGGDEPSNQRRKRHLPPESLNDRVKAFSYWSSMKVANADGEVNWNIPTSNFQGEVQLKAIVVNSVQVGGGTTKVLVSDPIKAKLSLPRFLVAGDRLNIPYRLFNQSEETQDLKVSVSVNNQPIFVKDAVVTVEPNQSKSSKLVLNTKMFDDSDSLILEIELKGNNDLKYTNQYIIPVMPATVKKVYSELLALKSSKTILLSKDLFKYSNPKLIVTQYADPRKSLKKHLEKLVAYPYGCAEQTSSKLFGLFELSKISNKNDIESISSFIRAGIAKLTTMQTYDGKFKYWRNGNYVNDFASVYASDILLKLDANDYKLTNAIRDNIIKSLKSYVKQKSNKIVALYAGYLLNRYSHLSRSQYHALYEQNNQSKNLLVQSFLYALSYRFNESIRSKEREIVILSLIKDYKIKREFSGNFQSVGRDKAMALALYLNNGGSRAMVESLLDTLFSKLSKGKLYSTQDQALTLGLFTNEMRTWPQSGTTPTIKANRQSYKLKNSSPFEKLLTDREITLRVDDGFSYVSIEVLYEDELQVTKKPSPKDLYLNTKLVDKYGVELNIDQLKVSQKVFKEIKISSAKPMDNIVLVSKSSACFETINPRLNKSFSLPKKLSNQNVVINNIDIRDDRLLAFMSIKKTGVYYHPMQVSFSGKCMDLGTKIEAMYDSRLSDSYLPVESYIIK